MYIVFAVIAFSLLILIHELGHFTLAKLNGVKVDEFSIGMGPKLFSIKGKETEYMIKALPIGGYVKMYGEEETTNDNRGFMSKSPLQRISIIFAGAFMNYVLAIVLFSIFTFHSGYAIPVVKDVVKDSPAAKAGLMQGDQITKVNNSTVLTKDDLTYEIAMSKGNAVDVQLKRGSETKNFSIVPTKNSDGILMIGITNDFVENPSVVQSVKYSFKGTASWVKQTFSALKTIFTGKANLKTDVGGPVTIVKMTGTAAKSGIVTLIWFTAYLSVQLAVFNLLPFPALDGGWIIMLLFELITRKKVPDKVVGALNFVGFSLLMLLMLLVTVKDILFPVNL
ncbi:zinc metalloprotease [Clostridium zeae]|uniref:Zinc metalloprotease n=1 Tax=Clostridium zeae TaxID=2759022 RepID=A0ABQ1E4I2_9CLOT|nr:RIP metalloprotease RseP [Clostridium zeae]GFZ29638.1 zinc metalloprotease [Clostridium zeae]